MVEGAGLEACQRELVSLKEEMAQQVSEMEGVRAELAALREEHSATVEQLGEAEGEREHLDGQVRNFLPKPWTIVRRF